MRTSSSLESISSTHVVLTEVPTKYLKYRFDTLLQRVPKHDNGTTWAYSIELGTTSLGDSLMPLGGYC